MHLLLGLALFLTVRTFDVTPAVYFARLDPASQDSLRLVSILVWGTTFAWLACLFVPLLRFWLRWRYASPLLLAFMAWMIHAAAGVRGRDWAIAMSYGTLIPITVLIGPALVMATGHRLVRSRWWRELFEFGRGHCAKWATTPEYHRFHIALPRKGKNGLYGWTVWLFLGRTTFRDDFMPRYVALKTNVHHVLLGMSGSGKDSTATALQLGLYGGRCLSLDLKGEQYRITSRRRRELGPVKNCDAFGVTGGEDDGFNALAGVDATTIEGQEVCREFSEACVLNEQSLGAGSHFSDNAKTLLTGITTHVCSVFPMPERNPVTVFDLVTSRDPESGGYDPKVWDDLLAAMSQNPVGGGVCVQAAKLMADVGGNEGGSFLSTLSKSIKWIGHPAMRRHLTSANWSMKELATSPENMTIYASLGIGREEAFKRYYRVVAATSIYYLRAEYRRTRQKPSPPCLILCTEYPLYAKGLECLSSGFGNLREAGICLSVQAQKYSQLLECLGDKNASLLMQNSTVQVLGVHNDDDDTAKWVSETLGQHSVPEVDRSHVVPLAARAAMQPLMTRREVMDALGQTSPSQIIFPVNAPPMWLRRQAYCKFTIDGRQAFDALPLDGMFDQP
jgi:type IV secretory pathway TraG/TraD family ATPase VirD4